MHLNLSPYATLPDSADSLHVALLGDALTINGTVYDFGPLPDGATLPAEAINCPYINTPVERIEGVLHLTLRMPLEDSASEAARFTAPIINPPDGHLELPQ